MRFEKTVKEQYTSIKLLEEKLDSRISPNLKSEFILLNTNGVSNIILNLEDVKYVDSSGLSAILTANRLCNGAGGTFVVCCANEFISKLVKISHLDTVLSLLPTEEEASSEIFMAMLENEVSAEESQDS